MKYYESIFLLLIVPLFLFGGKDTSESKWHGTANTPGAAPAFPEMSIANVRVVEGDVEQRSVEVMVALSEVASGPVTVAYSTKDGTASTGSDYVAANGLITFAKGEMVRKIVVTIIGDKVCESDETFQILLRDSSGATVVGNIGIVTIVNDDFRCGERDSKDGGSSAKGNSTGGKDNSTGDNGNSTNNDSKDEKRDLKGGNLALYEVRLTYTGYTTFYGSAADCAIRPNGKVTLTGLLFGAEDVSSDDDIMYTGVLQLDIDMDICSAKRLPNGEDRLCGITVLGCGPVKTELEVQYDQRGGYVKIEDEAHEFIKLAVGNCDKAQVTEEQDMTPNKTIASIFNGTPLPMLTNRTLSVGRYVETGPAGEMVVEVLRKVR